jgi:hypothetical protein
MAVEAQAAASGPATAARSHRRIIENKIVSSENFTTGFVKIFEFNHKIKKFKMGETSKKNGDISSVF